MKIIHVDMKGNVIPDISKVVLPLDVTIDVFNILKGTNIPKTKEWSK